MNQSSGTFPPPAQGKAKGVPADPKPRADEHIYFLPEEGETTVVAANATFDALSRNRLNERCQASLAISHGQLFIRTAGHVFCIGKK